MRKMLIAIVIAMFGITHCYAEDAPAAEISGTIQPSVITLVAGTTIEIATAPKEAKPLSVPDWDVVRFRATDDQRNGGLSSADQKSTDGKRMAVGFINTTKLDEVLSASKDVKVSAGWPSNNAYFQAVVDSDGFLTGIMLFLADGSQGLVEFEQFKMARVRAGYGWFNNHTNIRVLPIVVVAK